MMQAVVVAFKLHILYSMYLLEDIAQRFTQHFALYFHIYFI